MTDLSKLTPNAETIAALVEAAPPLIENVYCFPNGMVAVTDQRGQQMPEYQGRYEEVWPKIQLALQPHSQVHS